MDWYDENIEAGVRPVVRLLRDHGFNTVSSCHHDLSVQMDMAPTGELQRLHDVLYNHGLRRYSVSFHLNVEAGHVVGCWAQLDLSDGDHARRGDEPCSTASC